MENRINKKPLINITKDSKIDYNDYNNYLNNIISKYINLNEDDNNDEEEIQNKESVQYFESKKNIQENDDELKINHNSKKDCVEYGLNNEQYIMCTKYE